MKTYIVIITTVFIFACSACGSSRMDPIPVSSTTPNLLRGDIVDDIYENSHLNLIFTLPDEWRFEAVEDLIYFSQNHELSTNHGLAPTPGAHEASYYEFYAKDYLGGIESIIFVIENMAEYDEIFSEDDFIEMLVEQYATLKDVDYSVGESYTINIAEHEMTAIQVFEENTRLYQRHLLCQEDEIMLSFTATAKSEEALDEIISHLEF